MKIRFKHSSKDKLNWKLLSGITHESAIMALEERIQYLGGAWWALQKYGGAVVGPFKISIYEALANEVLKVFDAESEDAVIAEVRKRYDLKKGL